MLSDDEVQQLETLVRRVVREELQRQHSGTSRPRRAPVQERPRGAIGTDDEGMQNVREALAYMERIDPDGRMTQEEARTALWAHFPQWRP